MGQSRSQIVVRKSPNSWRLSSSNFIFLNRPLRAPPFGHSTQLRVFIDPDLLQYDEVWAAAGTWNDNFGANPNDIVRVAGGVVTDLKRA